MTGSSSGGGSLLLTSSGGGDWVASRLLRSAVRKGRSVGGIKSLVAGVRVPLNAGGGWTVGSGELGEGRWGDGTAVGDFDVGAADVNLSTACIGGLVETNVLDADDVLSGRELGWELEAESGYVSGSRAKLFRKVDNFTSTFQQR